MNSTYLLSFALDVYSNVYSWSRKKFTNYLILHCIIAGEWNCDDIDLRIAAGQFLLHEHIIKIY